jgi:hypothetical protein
MSWLNEHSYFMLSGNEPTILIGFGGHGHTGQQGLQRWTIRKFCLHFFWLSFSITALWRHTILWCSRPLFYAIQREFHSYIYGFAGMNIFVDHIIFFIAACMKYMFKSNELINFIFLLMFYIYFFNLNFISCVFVGFFWLGNVQ